MAGVAGDPDGLFLVETSGFPQKTPFSHPNRRIGLGARPKGSLFDDFRLEMGVFRAGPDLQARLAAVQAYFAGVQAHFAGVQAHFAGVQAHFSDLPTGFAGLQGHFADLLAPFADLLAPFADLLPHSADLRAHPATLLSHPADLLAHPADLLAHRPILVRGRPGSSSFTSITISPLAEGCTVTRGNFIGAGSFNFNLLKPVANSGT